jgi:molecular chaperone DnaK (HSP70)
MNQPPLPNIKPKSTIKFSVHWMLTIFLLMYSLFSFAWISVLYSGVDGSRICSDDSNAICRIEFPLTKQATIVNNDKVEISKQAISQKAGKNYIRNLWSTQTTLSDDVVGAAEDYEQASNEFKNYTNNYVRFIDGKAELLNGFSKSDFDNKKSTMEDALANLRQKRNQYAQSKIDNKSKIDQLYSDLKEKQDNTFRTTR